MSDNIKSLADAPRFLSERELLEKILNGLQKQNTTLCDILDCLSEISDKLDREERSPWA